MSAVYWSIKGSISEEEDIRHVYVAELNGGCEDWFLNLQSV